MPKLFKVGWILIACQCSSQIILKVRIWALLKATQQFWNNTQIRCLVNKASWTLSLGKSKCQSMQVKKQRCQQANKFPRNAFEKAIKRFHGCQWPLWYDSIPLFKPRYGSVLGERVGLLERLSVFFFCLFLLRLSSAGSLESQSRTAYKSLISTGGGRQWVWGACEVCQRVWTHTSRPTTISHKSLLLSCVWFKACLPGKFDTGYVGRARANLCIHPRGRARIPVNIASLEPIRGLYPGRQQQHGGPNPLHPSQLISLLCRCT